MCAVFVRAAVFCSFIGFADRRARPRTAPLAALQKRRLDCARISANILRALYLFEIIGLGRSKTGARAKKRKEFAKTKRAALPAHDIARFSRDLFAIAQRTSARAAAAQIHSANSALDLFNTFKLKHIAAVNCLENDREALLSFYDFPAEHWMHIRTTNPIESVFATVRLRHDKTKGNGSHIASLTMFFKLMESASKRW